MHSKMRLRFYCDFCRKSGGSGGHMARHEKGCTANPKRHCSLCEIAGLDQSPIGDLLATLDEDIEADIRAKSTDFYDIPKILIPRLKQLTNNCPACILSAVRFREGYEIDFTYSDAHESFWQEVNNARSDCKDCHEDQATHPVRRRMQRHRPTLRLCVPSTCGTPHDPRRNRV